VASGHLTAVIVEGEAGIGKTRLLADALDGARGRALQVVAGRTQELERTRPFGVLADAFACSGSSPDPPRRAIAALLATQGRRRLRRPDGVDGTAVVALITMHVVVGFILIWGFARFGRQPSWTTQ
jgi:hypothetical protein